jgi:hypothetical protein
MTNKVTEAAYKAQIAFTGLKAASSKATRLQREQLYESLKHRQNETKP